MKPVKNNIVALGSAAVFAVYSAGFMRTKSAADRLGGNDAERARVVATAVHDPEPAPALASVTPALDPTPKTRAKPATSDGKDAHPTRTPTSGIDSTAPAQVAIVDTVPVPQVVMPTTTAPVPVSPVQAISADVPAVDSAAQKKAAAFKDGIYSGWGTSRHGDIQATVEIRDGRIISASITQCLTRYSCSWISTLPPQVVSRQSPNVDFVSGATQSTNAFYSAIVEALSKAK